MGGFIVTIPERLISYIAPSTPSLPHLKELKEVSSF
jgi:hypothetical protein